MKEERANTLSNFADEEYSVSNALIDSSIVLKAANFQAI
jgi:hypothetical protein